MVIYRRTVQVDVRSFQAELTSVPQMPEASTLTRTLSRPTGGTLTSLNSIISGPTRTHALFEVGWTIGLESEVHHEGT